MGQMYKIIFVDNGSGQTISDSNTLRMPRVPNIDEGVILKNLPYRVIMVVTDESKSIHYVSVMTTLDYDKMMSHGRN